MEPKIGIEGGPASSKKKTGLVAGIVVLIIVTVTGVGFGVYEMIQNNSKQNEVENLKTEVNKRDVTIAKIEENLGAKIDMNEMETIVVAQTSSPDYVYIGQWGIKIKIPENLKEVSYLVNTTNDGYSRGFLVVSGVKEDSGRQYVPEFADIEKNKCHSALMRVKKGSIGDGGAAWYVLEDRAVYERGDYYYVYLRPQAVCSDKSEQQWEADTVNLIETMLSDPRNFSEF